MTDDQNHSVQGALRIGLDVTVGKDIQAQFGGGVDIGQASFWDHTTEFGMGTTATSTNTINSSAATSITWSHAPNVTLIAGSGRMCQVTRPPGATKPDGYQYNCTPAEVPTFNVPNEHDAYEAYW